MQTFLPLPSFDLSARCLDNRRLGNQRNETTVILRACLDPDAPWARHPAVIMWRGHEGQLAAYGRAILREWDRRGYRNTVQYPDLPLGDMPPWFENWDFHASHRAALLRKDAQHYGQFGWTEAHGDVIWPSMGQEKSPGD